MRYYLRAESQEGERFANILAEELFRFDIRAQVNGFDELDLFVAGNHRRITLNPDEYDLVILIGTRFDAQKRRRARKYGKKSCFIAIDSSKLNVSSATKFDLAYWDVPINSPKIKYVGNYFLDIMNGHEYEELPPSKKYRFGFLTSKHQLDRHTLKLLKEIRRKYKEAEIFINDQSCVANELRNLNLHAAPELDILKICNLTFTTSNSFSLKAALLNCPQVNVNYSNRLGLFKSKGPSTVNQLLKNEVIPMFSIKRTSLILDELDKILTDHQYCAAMMSEYQNVRAQLQSPAARNMAKEIVDLMEN